MVYKMWMKQTGEGCDYTIACGQKLFDLKATDIESAKEEARELIDEVTNDEVQVDTAYILNVVEDITEMGDEIEEMRLERRRKIELEKKREQLERLKAELGE